MFTCKIYFCVSRLLKAFAEEQALEDAIYYLGEALRKNVIDLEVFLKVNSCETLRFMDIHLREISDLEVYSSLLDIHKHYLFFHYTVLPTKDVMHIVG